MALPRIILGWPIWLAMVGDSVLAFNINSDIPIIFQDPKGPGGYFGYTTAFHFNGSLTSVLVSATKGNYTGYDASSPGVLYRCEYRTQSCGEIVLETTSKNTQRRDNDSRHVYTEDGSDDMWLGVSLDTQVKAPWDTMVCGHRWASPKTSYNLRRANSFFTMVGVCYRISAEMVMSKGGGTKDQYQKLLPLYSFDLTSRDVERRSINIIGSGIGMAGISSRYDDNQDLYIGTPGLYHFRGGVVSYRRPKEFESMSKPSLFVPPIDGFDDDDQYNGYALAIGCFYQKDESMVALGAPKGGTFNGKVIITKIEPQTVRSARYLESVDKLIGEQLGSYFGAALLAYKTADTNHRSILVVGAPLYSSKYGGDEGRAYVYVGEKNMMQKTITLEGQKVMDARFGSALACVGDVNLDGYNDIAVGAPYENNHGAVYIYHGTNDGVRPAYAQRIEGFQYGTRARGFGISIARSMDIDGNNYPDLLVGAYASDSAFLLRSHPIVQLSGSMNFSINNIDRETAKKCKIDNKEILCFVMSVCIVAKGKFLPENMTVSVNVEVDPTYDRGVFSIRNNLKKITEEMQLVPNTVKCILRDVFVIEHDNQDYITPVSFTASIVLKDPVQKGRPDFCPQCPVEDPETESKIFREIPFATGCEDDSICQCDLSVTAMVEGLDRADDLDDWIVLGSMKNILINTNVSNMGEPAFLAKMTLIIPQFVFLTKIPTECTTRSDANSVTSGSESYLECKVGNPLPRNGTVRIAVLLDISNIPNTQRELTVPVKVESTSVEISPQDCSTEVTLYFKAIANVDILGYPEEPLTIFKATEPSLSVNHKYEVKKNGPTPINMVIVTLNIPYADAKTGKPFLNIERISVWGTSGIIGRCDFAWDIMGNTSSLQDNDYVHSHNDSTENVEFDLGGRDTPNTFDPTKVTRETSIGGSKLSLGNHFEMDCLNTKCIKVTCTIGPFKRDGDGTTIDVQAKLNMTTLNETIGLTRNMTFISEGVVNILDDIAVSDEGLPTSNQRDEVSMIFVLKVPPPQLPLPKWIIAVSAGAGFLLLALIILGLIQLGFFQRKKHEEMQRQLLQASVVKKEDARQDQNDTQCTDDNQVENLQHTNDPDVFKI